MIVQASTIISMEFHYETIKMYCTVIIHVRALLLVRLLH